MNPIHGALLHCGGHAKTANATDLNHCAFRDSLSLHLYKRTKSPKLPLLYVAEAVDIDGRKPHQSPPHV